VGTKVERFCSFTYIGMFSSGATPHFRWELFMDRTKKESDREYEENTRIVEDYKLRSTQGIAYINDHITQAFNDKLHARPGYKKAIALPCIMGAFKIFVTCLKESAGDRTADTRS
jgi:hypothetical protein